MKPRVFVIFLIAIYICFFSYLSVLRYKAGFANEWQDVAWINGFYWNVLHGNWQELQKFYLNNHLQDFHISAAVFVFPLFYSLLPNIYFFLITPALFVAITAWPLYKLALKTLQNEYYALSVAAIYLLYAPKHSIVFVEDQGLVMLPLLALAYYWGDHSHWKKIFFGEYFYLYIKNRVSYFSIFSLIIFFD